MVERPERDVMHGEELPVHTVTAGPLLDLHGALVAGRVERPTRLRARQPVLLAAAALVVLAGVVGAIAVRSEPVAADVRVERDGATVTVSLSGDVSVEQLRRALDEAGVDVAIERRTTGPSRVGLFVGITTPSGTSLEGGDGVAGPTASFTEGDPVKLSLGVTASGDEPYDVQTDPTAPGEPLDGVELVGAPLGNAIDIAESAGLTVDARDAEGQPTSEPDLDASVLGGFMVSARDIVILAE